MPREAQTAGFAQLESRVGVIIKKTGRHGHTREYRGTKVFVTMSDGTHFVDVFIERPRHRRWIVLKDKGRIPMNKVKCLSKCKADGPAVTPAEQEPF